jgi:hypothetical protein
MHHFIRESDIRPTSAFSAEASGSLSDRDFGAVHTGWALCGPDPKGHVNQHLQSFEKSFSRRSPSAALLWFSPDREHFAEQLKNKTEAGR